MKYFLLILIILVTGKLNATPESNYFTCKGKNLTIDVIYRYENDIQKLYYESLTKNLDNYIENLKSEGKLNRGKIHFEIMTGIWMDKSIGVEMYRYKNGYYCWLNGLIQPINQDYLTKIITYFTYDSWESFCYNDSIVLPKTALNIFNKRIDSITPASNFNNRKIVELNYISVYFQNDSLICRNVNQNYGQIKYLLPFSKDSKDFITCGETIFVIENNELINKIELTQTDFTDGFYEQCWTEIFPKWINFKNGNGYFLSYSLVENKFYKL
jgi:hypothetical protein